MQAAFVQWLKDKGGYVNPKINLFHKTKSGDRGVFAEQDIQEGEQLLLVPVQATLHLDVDDITDTGAKVAATCRPQIAKYFQQQQQQQQPFSSFIATTLMLMAELATAADSDFEPYFKTLPASTDCLINWSEEDKQLLAGTSLETSGASIDDIFTSDILPRLQAAPQGLFPEQDPSLSCQAFKHAAELVQTRAFHMKADNWLTGASQESTDELYLIPAIDMLNHSTYPGTRNTTLALVRGRVEVTLEHGDKKTFSDFFSMKAECDIPKGTQVLHTYGDLSDAQLLQTYGFIDAPHPAAAAAPAVDAAAGKKSKKHKKGKGSSSTSIGAPAAAAEAGFSNPHNHVVLPMGVLLDAVRVVAAAARLWPAKKTKQLFASKLSYLSQSGLLPADQPEDSQLAITAAAAALPDDLLNIVQVLVMTEEEFQQLQQADQEEQQAAAADGSSEAAGADMPTPAAAGPAALDLGRELLQGEFGELCATVLLQAVGSCLKRLPADAASGASLLAAVAPGSRAWLAAAVAAAEEQQWQQIKKAALVLMLEVTQGADEDEDEDESEDESEDISELSSGPDLDEHGVVKLDRLLKAEILEGTERREAERAQDTKQQQQQQPIKKRKASSNKAAAAAAAGQQGRKEKQKQQKRHNSGKGAKDSRPHYGDMTGPEEEDMWQSDDSDKVGYSSDEDAGEEIAAAGGGSGRKAPRQRHLADGCEVHTYEVGGSGAVREVHGHMVGPEEADLIESDDSDKVGYCDAGSSGDEQKAAAAAAAPRGSKGKRNRGTARDASKPAAAAVKVGSSKKPKKGLGFKS